jgi:hypothetical protein
MKHTLTIALAVVLLLAHASVASDKETVEQMKARLQSAKPEESISLCLEIARRQLAAATTAYNAGNADTGKDLVLDVVSYSEKATETATRLHKKEKHVEIHLRELAKSLNEVHREVPFEDQAPVKAAADRLESLRTQLLKDMFKKD